jgi:hypothetical protein
VRTDEFRAVSDRPVSAMGQSWPNRVESGRYRSDGGP